MENIKKDIVNRVLNEADYILKTKHTIRETAKYFNVSKSTVHKDMQERLKELDKNKVKEIEKIMNEHIDVRHIRGGESTRLKYNNLKRQKLVEI